MGKYKQTFELSRNVALAGNGLAVWFCKPTTPLQSKDKLSKAYKLYRLLYAGRSKTQKL